MYMPKSLEGYWYDKLMMDLDGIFISHSCSQEVGRAGRDGLPSVCMMFLAAEDIPGKG